MFTGCRALLGDIQVAKINLAALIARHLVKIRVVTMANALKNAQRSVNYQEPMGPHIREPRAPKVHLPPTRQELPPVKT
jgi:hypothetical protein